MDVDGTGTQISLLEFDEDFAAYADNWVAAQEGPIKCSVCKRPLHADEAAAARLGEHCAAKIGRAVMANRAVGRAARLASATREPRRALRRARRAALA